ncbi:MAG TPA: hypothetical protein DCZ88_08900 [Pseudanabaena sp.]|nr:hypothetical protein [Pseudanabaena sp.]
MNKNLISKVFVISLNHIAFNIMMRFTESLAGSGSYIAQSLKKWLRLGIGEQYGVIKLICITFIMDSFLKGIL